MKGFTFFQNYFDAINDEENGLTEEEQGRLYNAIFSYMFRDEEPNLKGACKLAFNLIKPSLDLSKVRSNTKSKNQNAVEENQTEIKPKSKSNQTKSNQNQNTTKQNQIDIKTEQTETKSESSPFFENKEREKEDISTVGLNAGARESGDDVSEDIADYLEFMRNHPEVHEDISNPSEVLSVDFKVLSERIAESHFLQTRQSLSWLIGNYSKIVAGGYKDFPRSSAKDAPKGKGDLQLWQETVRALQRAKSDVYCASNGYNVPAYKMADEEAKRVMAEIYKSLSREITEYFDPNSFLELCGMEEKDLKFERARFLKALPDIRAKITEE